MTDATSRDDIRDAEIHDVTGYDITTEQAEGLFAEALVPRSKRTIQRYCKSGYLDCKEYGTANGMMLRINRDSIERRIKEIQQIQSTVDRRDKPRPTTTSSDDDGVKFQGGDAPNDRRQTETDDDARNRRYMAPDDLQANDTGVDQRQSATNTFRRNPSSASVNDKLVDALVRQLDAKDDLIDDLKSARRSDRKFFTFQLEQLQKKHVQEVEMMHEVLQPLIDFYTATQGRELREGQPISERSDGLVDAGSDHQNDSSESATLAISTRQPLINTHVRKSRFQQRR